MRAVRERVCHCAHFTVHAQFLPDALLLNLLLHLHRPQLSLLWLFRTIAALPRVTFTTSTDATSLATALAIPSARSQEATFATAHTATSTSAYAAATASSPTKLWAAVLRKCFCQGHRL